MTQRRSYSRTYRERNGIRSYRGVDGDRYAKPEVLLPTDGKPSCVIIANKRKGFGSLGNQESQPVSHNNADYLLNALPPERYERYRVNVYLKKTGASAIRRKDRGW